MHKYFARLAMKTRLVFNMGSNVHPPHHKARETLGRRWQWAKVEFENKT